MASCVLVGGATGYELGKVKIERDEWGIPHVVRRERRLEGFLLGALAGAVTGAAICTIFY
jgi:hypothetical protein